MSPKVLSIKKKSTKKSDKKFLTNPSKVIIVVFLLMARPDLEKVTPWLDMDPT